MHKIFNEIYMYVCDSVLMWCIRNICVCDRIFNVICMYMIVYLMWYICMW